MSVWNVPPDGRALQRRVRCNAMFAAVGLKDIKIETITGTTEFQTGKDLWDWLVWSNPIVEMVLGSLDLSKDDTAVIQQTLEKMVCERSGERPRRLDQPSPHRSRHEVKVPLRPAAMRLPVGRLLILQTRGAP